MTFRPLGVAALSAVLALSAAMPAMGVQRFRSPTGNILCGYLTSYEDPYRVASVSCLTANDSLGMRLWADGDRFRGRLPRIAVRVSRGRGPVLGYGRARNLGPFRCESTYDGMTCYIRWSGEGFFINRDSWEWL